MSKKNLITSIEEQSMNAIPSIRTEIYDGWVLRFSDGYTKRGNSINPLYFSKGNLKRKIENIEQIYKARNLKVVYKMTDQVHPSDLDKVLEKSGYCLEGVTSVQILPLIAIEKPSGSKVLLYHTFHEKWFHSFCEINDICDSQQPILKKVLEKITPETCYISLTDPSDTVVACGLGVLEDEYIGLFEIITKKGFRKQGYGKELIQHLLYWGKEKGAKYAYLQVVLDNIPALKLYSKFGFEEKYTYWYRIKN